MSVEVLIDAAADVDFLNIHRQADMKSGVVMVAIGDFIFICGDFQLSPVVNNTHDLVIFPSTSGLRKMHSQDGNV